ncbi:hypothetical protein YC2023_004849 [Brassica napus]
METTKTCVKLFWVVILAIALSNYNVMAQYLDIALQNVVQLITLMNAIMTVERNGSEMETVIQKLKCVVVLEPRFISLWVE